MDLIIKNVDLFLVKNIERTKKYSEKNHQQLERIEVDFNKLETNEFTQLFFSACEKYAKTEDDGSLCTKCKYKFVDEDKDPCRSCLDSAIIRPNWEPKGPTLKEATERMQGEFDATGKDVRVFMNGRIIKR